MEISICLLAHRVLVYRDGMIVFPLWIKEKPLKFNSILLIFFVIIPSACEDGSAERLGENIDDAARDAGNAVEDLCEDIRDAVDAADRNC